MTTKLIQELVGLAVEKSKGSDLHLYIEHKIAGGELLNIKVYVFKRGQLMLDLSFKNDSTQLQAAIEKVKQL